MAIKRRHVTEIERGDRLPEDLNEFVILAESLEQRGFFEETGNRLPLSRRGGFCTPAIIGFLLSFFVSQASGLRPFYEKFRQWWLELALVCGLKQLPSSASISRALGKIEVAEAREFGLWLLQQAVDHAPLLEMEGVVAVDHQGTAWHVLDYDPKVDVFRQRALPEGEDLPEPERRLGDLAAPGYPGRKRGEVQLARGLLQHSGTGLWLSASIGAGNGQPREDFEWAVSAASRWAAIYGVDPAKVLLRFDGGVGGNVPNVTACREAGLPFLTRLARYELLDDAADYLAEADWSPVEDSGSGPTREAAEFGRVVLTPKPETRRANGQPYQPVRVRVVVSRFASPAKRGAGAWREGYQYELYATELPAAGWPAAAVVTGYYGRCGQENRFAQENSELRLDQVFSCQPGGQLLASSVGQFLWNLRTCRGAQLLGAVQVPSRTDDEQAVQDAPPRAEQPSPPQSAEAVADEIIPNALSVDEAGSAKSSSRADPEAVLGSAPDVPSRETAEPRCSVRGTSRWLASLALIACLSWGDRLRPGWRFAESAGLICPNDQSIPLYRLDEVGTDAVAIRFRAPRGTCTSCPIRQNCTSSSSRRFRKEVQTTAGVAEFEDAQELKKVLTIAHPSPPPKKRVLPRWRPPDLATPATGSCRWPRLLPSIFRKQHQTTAGQLEVAIHHKPASRHDIAPLKWLATDAADKQHRRHTYSQRHARNRLPDDTHVEIHYGVRSNDARRLAELQ